MIDLPDYNKATNAAYEELQDYDGKYPQIDIFYLLQNHPKIKLHTFTEIASRLGITVEEFVAELSESDMGYTVYDRVKERWLIYYNDTKCDTTIRFTIAHELGHIALKHTEDNSITDREANCFARNLLCPVPIRDELDLKTLEDFCSAFGISDRMAKVVMEMNSSDSYYISGYNYGAVNDKAYCYFTGYTLEELYGY